MTAVAQIIDWVNGNARPMWLRHSLRLLLNKNKLDNDDFELLFRIARVESGFPGDINLHEYGLPVSADGYRVEEHPVVLKKLGPMTNIGLIADGTTLELPETGLTVIYGNNGAGKSSYARVLKNACFSRGDKPQILSDIFKDELETPQAEIQYKIGEQEPTTVTWSHKNSDIPELKAIRVFDTKSASHYVEREGTLSYKPAGHHLIDGLSSISLYIKEQTHKALENKSVPHELPKLNFGTEASKFLQQISKDTTKEQLEQQLIQQDELKELEALPLEIAKLSTNTPDKIRKEYIRKIDRYKAFSRHVMPRLCSVSDFEFSKIEKIRTELVTNKKALEIARNKAFSDLPIRGVGSSAWKKLWDAAKKYSEVAYPGLDFPIVENAKCPLCIQELDHMALARLRGFKDFVESTVQAEVDQVESKFNQAQKALLNLDFDLAESSSVINEISEVIEGFDEKITSLYENLSERSKFLCIPLDQKRSESIFRDLNLSCLEKLSSLILKLTQELLSVKDNDGLNKLILEKNNRLKELQDKKLLTDNQTTIVMEISRRRSIYAYSQIEKQANTGGLTRLSTQINNLYVTSALEKYFQEELNFFGFKYYDVGTKTRGDVANQKFKLEIANSNHPTISDIASEGEAKCFALSGAIAELRTDSRFSGVVFDDPVNSLDHRWTSKVAKRLVKESLERQVIVFTHDIVFLKLICEANESYPGASLVIKSLDRSINVSGIVRTNPPWDALTTSKRITYLNVLHRELKRLEREGTEAEYDQKAGHFYGLLREAWERLVEEKLLNRVVERFSREIPTQRLKRLIDIEQSDVDRVSRAMSKCSGLLDGHDTAPGLYENMPDTQEIRADIEDLKSYEQELTTKRKRT